MKGKLRYVHWRALGSARPPRRSGGARFGRDGRVEGAVYGVGARRMQEVDAATGVRFLPNDCSDEAEARAKSATPGYGFVTLPKGRLTGIDEDTCITAYPLYLVTSTEIPEEVVAAVTGALYENASKLADFHPTLRSRKAETSVSPDATLPYHEAAVRAYEKAGAWSAEAAQAQKALLAD